MGKTLGIVLKSADYRDNHKMITLFSREEGKISLMVPGAKSLKNGLASATQPLSCGVCVYDEKQGRRTLKQFDLKKSYFSLAENYEAYVTACDLVYFTDSVLADIDDPDAFFIIFVNAVDALARGVNPEQVINFFSLKFLEFLGLAPELDSCVTCGAGKSVRWYFAPDEGGIICESCALSTRCVIFDPEMRQAMADALNTRPVEFKGIKGLDGELSDIIAEYLYRMTELGIGKHERPRY